MDTNELNELLPPPKTNLEGLIGLAFKRNKYGLSQWTDKISYVGYSSKLINRTTRTIQIHIIGTITKQWYYLDEIVIVDKPLHWIEEAQMQKRELHEKIKNGTYNGQSNTDESN